MRPHAGFVLMTERYEPSRPLPPYTYIPGRTPHPKSDPLGHSYDAAEPQLSPLDANRLDASPDFGYAVDLFHAGYYWEAHEFWESLWHAVGRRGATASALKGLIRLAAAGVKVREGNAAGIASHLVRAAELLEEACSGGTAMIGRLDLSEVATATRKLDPCGLVAANDDDVAPRAVWRLQLVLK